ncbi:MAG: hypothetical protein QXT76_03165 [Sulfolobales archaeon]
MGEVKYVVRLQSDKIDELVVRAGSRYATRVSLPRVLRKSRGLRWVCPYIE